MQTSEVLNKAAGRRVMSTPVQMPLKRKYRSAIKGRNRAVGDHQNNNKRHKVGFAAHVARYGEPRKRVMYVDGRTGKSVMGDAR